MRHMTTEDLGDPRLYEDEAIREQAAALQIHLENLGNKIAASNYLSSSTLWRIAAVFFTAKRAQELAEATNEPTKT